jgi:pimeloyl-ACP methyl ester carboxylesterase
MRFLALAALPLLAAAIALLSGCVSLRPFEQVRQGLPADRYVRVSDQYVHVEQAGPAGAEPVVLIHGFGASTYSWRNIIPTLSGSFRTLAVDLNGFGYTQRPRDAASYSREGQVRLVLGILDELGIEKAHFVGHSYGGALTQWIVSRHPERVRSFVLVDSAAPTYPEDRRSAVAAFRPLSTLFLRSFALREDSVRKALRKSVADPAVVTDELVRAYWERLTIEGVSDAYYGLTAPRRGKLGSSERVVFEDLDLPGLVVWGSEDRLVRLEDGRAAAARMPQARFVVMEEVGHLPMEERPEELSRLLLEFLTSQARPGSPGSGSPERG